MIVVRVIEEMFVPRDAVGKVDFARQAALRQQSSSSDRRWYSRFADPVSHRPVNVFDAAMPFVIQEGFQNQFAMRGDFSLFSRRYSMNTCISLERLHGPGWVGGNNFTTSL